MIPAASIFSTSFLITSVFSGVARKKADPEYLDVFKVGADGKAVRKARVLGKGIRFRFGVVGDNFWLLERSTGFDRGGRALTIYSLAG